MHRNGSAITLVSSLVGKPNLWVEAVRTGFSMSRSGLVPNPIPDPAYLGWRLETVYADAQMHGSDVIAYLQWRKRQRKLGR